MRRMAPFLKEVVSIWKESGFRGSMKFAKSRVFERQSEMLLFELRTNGQVPVTPAGWTVRVVLSREDSAGVALICKAGGEEDLRHFSRKAIAYVLSIGEEPVAQTWYYPNHPLARRLGPDTVYFGNTFVRPAWRGQGIQAWFNLYKASLLPIGTRVVMEVRPANVASQRGLAKANFVCLGRLHMTVLLGQVIRARVVEQPPVDQPST